MLFTTAPVWASYSVYLKNPSPSRDQISRPAASNTCSVTTAVPGPFWAVVTVGSVVRWETICVVPAVNV